ncbi:MAG: LacI family DNA-binding transcriptional regulator [Fibrella sp.]|nr:LacI family DNA-binding transcriptional regulator [Armatimonadota bacterium]
MKAGILPVSGSQRYKCSVCRRRYTIETRPRGYAESVREAATALHEQGLGVRAIARQLGVNPQSVVNWLRRTGEHSGTPGIASSSPHPPEKPVPALSEEKRRTTITDVARHAGVSNSTVSNFLNDKGRMSLTTRQRVQDAMDALHFTPSALVRAIRHRRSGIVGVMLFGLDTLDEGVGRSIVPPLLAGINAAAIAAGYNVLLYPGWLSWPQTQPGLPFLDGHVDGLLWIAPRWEEPALQRVADAGLPTVVVLSRHVPPGVGYVNADNFDAIYQSVQHLYALGHRRIAYCGPVHDSNFRDRQEGYRRALERVGLPFEPELEFVDTDFVWMRPTYSRVLDRWFALPAPPTAIVLPDDGLADRMITELAERGARVPEDVALTGINDLPDAERIGGGLTTIRQPFREMGRLAMERLLALLGGASIETCQVSVATTLTVRKTTGKR